MPFATVPRDHMRMGLTKEKEEEKGKKKGKKENFFYTSSILIAKSVFGQLEGGDQKRKTVCLCSLPTNGRGRKGGEKKKKNGPVLGRGELFGEEWVRQGREERGKGGKKKTSSYKMTSFDYPRGRRKGGEKKKKKKEEKRFNVLHSLRRH